MSGTLRYWDGTQWQTAIGPTGPVGPMGPTGPAGPYGTAGGDLTGSYPNPSVQSVQGGSAIKAPTVWRGALVWDTDNSVPGGASYQTEAIVNSLTNSTGINQNTAPTGDITISAPITNNSHLINVSQAVGSTTISDQNTTPVIQAGSYSGMLTNGGNQVVAVVYSPTSSVYMITACCQTSNNINLSFFVQVTDGVGLRTFYMFGSTASAAGSLYCINNFNTSASVMCMPMVVHNYNGPNIVLYGAANANAAYIYGAIEKIG